MTETPRPKTDAPATSTKAGRVLLALQGSTPPSAALATATALARSLQAELAALFVEDIELLRLAALPFTREVGRASGVIRPFEARDLERTLRWQAEQLRGTLAAAAEAMALPWSFQVTRGSLLEQVMAAASASPVVLAQRQRALEPPSGGPTLAASASLVSALLDASNAGMRALAAAFDLAQGQVERLVLLAPAGAVAELEALRERASAQLNLRGSAPAVHPVVAEAAALAREIRRRHSQALVLSLGSLPDAPAQLRVLLQLSPCPLVLVP